MNENRDGAPLPWLAVQLLRILLPSGAREFILGDLEEEYARQTLVRRSPWTARAWLWKQVFATVWDQRAKRTRTLAPRPRGFSLLHDALARELGFALRSFRTRPLFTATAVLTLALGIGPTLAIASLVRSTLLQPPPFRDPDQLVFVWSRLDRAPEQRVRVALPDFAELRSAQQLEDVAATNNLHEAGLESDGAEPQAIHLGLATPNFFDLLGVRLALGTFAGESDAAEGTPLLLSDDLWRGRFGANPRVLGSTVLIDGNSYVVRGVLPREFALRLPPDVGLPTSVDAWSPLGAGAFSRDDRPPLLRDQDSDNTGVVVARVREGATLAAVGAELDRVATSLRAEIPEHETAGLRFEVEPLAADGVRYVRPLLLALLAASLLVLGAAAMNGTQLMLLRVVSRESDTSVRVALGASRSRLLLQAFVEATTLGVLGVVVSLAFAAGIERLLLRLAPEGLRAEPSGPLGASDVVSAVGVAALLVLMMSIGPAARAMRGTGRSEDRGRTASPRSVRSRDALVSAQVATAGVLLLATLLLLRSASALGRVDPGFRAENALTFDLSLPYFARYRGPAERNRFTEQLEERLAAIPGVDEVGVGTVLPLSGNDWTNAFGRAGEPPESWLSNQADFRMVTAGFFGAVGVPLIAGRTFSRADDSEARRVVIVNDALAARLSTPGQTVTSVLGSRIGFPLDGKIVEAEIIGVVGTVRHESLAEAGREAFYVPYRHEATRSISVVVRTSSDPEPLGNAVRAAVAEVDPRLPIQRMRTLESYVEEASAKLRFALFLLAAYAAVALVLGAVGLYGVTGYAVNQRRREMGVRLALGADRSALIASWMAGGARRIVFGAGIAAALGVPFAMLLRSLLFAVTPFDPVAWLLAALLLAVVATLACYVPARRIARLEPTDALRYE